VSTAAHQVSEARHPFDRCDPTFVPELDGPALERVGCLVFNDARRQEIEMTLLAAVAGSDHAARAISASGSPADRPAPVVR
jgi:hypothetical protein